MNNTDQQPIEWWNKLSKDNQLLYFNKYKKLRQIKGLPIEQITSYEIKQIFDYRKVLVKDKCCGKCDGENWICVNDKENK
jgi:hypothetical protein